MLTARILRLFVVPQTILFRKAVILSMAFHAWIDLNVWMTCFLMQHIPLEMLLKAGHPCPAYVWILKVSCLYTLLKKINSLFTYYEKKLAVYLHLCKLDLGYMPCPKKVHVIIMTMFVAWKSYPRLLYNQEKNVQDQDMNVFPFMLVIQANHLTKVHKVHFWN